MKYGYDLDGRMIAANDNGATLAAISGPTSLSVSATYDALNRPISFNWNPVATQTIPASPSSVIFNHTYDANNRRVGQTASDSSWVQYPGGAGTTAYTANALNQYTAVASVTPTYDGNGNLTFDGTFIYAYDAESRLTSVTQGTTTVATYAYDAQGRRKSKTVSGATTAYVTDADNREALEYNGSTGALQTWYAYGSGPNEVLNQINIAAGTRSTLIPDIIGSTIGTLASSGTLTKIGYLPFGESSGTTTASNGFFFTGGRLDAETVGSASQPSGIYYLRNRMYLPGWGRFPQADPSGYGAGPNLYTYALNNPLSLVDPFGTIGQCIGAACSAIPQALASMSSAQSSGLISAGQKSDLITVNNYVNGSSVNVVFTSNLPTSQYAAGTTYSGGISTIQINPQYVSNPDGTVNVQMLGSVLTHEGTHGFDMTAISGPVSTTTQETWTETNAYTNQSAYNQANGGQPLNIQSSVQGSLSAWTAAYQQANGHAPPPLTDGTPDAAGAGSSGPSK